MKLSLLQENLNTALTNVSRFVSSKSQLPILNNILISTDNGRLKLSATNLELGINYWIGAKIEQEGQLAVPSKEITEFISYLSSGKIDINQENSLLKIISQKAESTFTTISSSDFPSLPQIDPNTIFELDLNSLIQSIPEIVFSAATEDTRPVLTSVLCQFTSTDLLLVATDGFRLSFKKITFPNPIDLHDQKSLNLLIPNKSLIEIIKLSKNTKVLKIGLTTDGHQIVFVLDDTEIISRLIDGEYPDYARIIPDSYATKIYLNKDDFNQAIKIASVFARESANVVRFNIKLDKIELTANAPQIGQNKATIDARIEGEALDIAFNYKFVSDFLSICKGKEIVIQLNESLTPGFFQDQSNPELTHIIMPVRLQD